MNKTILVLSFILSLTALSFLYVNKAEAGVTLPDLADGRSIACIVVCIPQEFTAPRHPQQGHMTYVGIGNCDTISSPAPPPTDNPGDPPLCPENTTTLFIPVIIPLIP